MTGYFTQIPERLLKAAVRRMPAERSEWSAAMLAELAQLQHPVTRWRFALGCTRVALFPPRRHPLLIGGIMNVYVRKLRGVTGISLIWAPAYAAMLASLMGIVALFIPIRGDVSPLRMLAIIAQVGFISGGLFGVLFSFAEDGKAIRHLSLGRAALWGVLSSAVFPILTGRADQVIWICPFGAIVALTLVALARQAARREANQARRNRFLACALWPVRDAVNPTQESAT